MKNRIHVMEMECEVLLMGGGEKEEREKEKEKERGEGGRELPLQKKGMQRGRKQRTVT